MIRTLLPRTLVRSFVLAVAKILAAATGYAQVQPGNQSRWSLNFRLKHGAILGASH
jgi:hypothetical protein